jgi:hypothetical protein
MKLSETPKDYKSTRSFDLHGGCIGGGALEDIFQRMMPDNFRIEKLPKNVP